MTNFKSNLILGIIIFLWIISAVLFCYKYRHSDIREHISYTTALDQKLRRELFCECLKNVPQGPEVVNKSDWSKIVSNCASYAYYTALVKVPKDSVKGNIVNP